MNAAYRTLTWLISPFVPLLLRRRLARGKEDPARLGERLGRPARARPKGILVWLHAASVGEANSLLGLIARLLQGRIDMHALVTSGTVTSARLLGERLPARAFHQFVPFDTPQAARRFVDHWHPDAVLWTESELWPNLLFEVARQQVPALLVNARMSEKSFNLWRRWPGPSAATLAVFTRVLAQSEADAERFRTLGAAGVQCLGNLKAFADPLPADPAALKNLRDSVGSRPLFLAASTHRGEEAIVARVHRALRSDHPDLLTIIVPRHPERGGVIAEEIASAGLTVVRRSADAVPTSETEIYLGDTLGELGVFYRLADIAFIGGSLVPHGGQNLIEAARLGCALISGPWSDNFADAVAALKAGGGLIEIADGDALGVAVDGLLRQPARAEEMQQRAKEVALQTGAHGLQPIYQAIVAVAPVLAGSGEEAGRQSHARA